MLTDLRDSAVTDSSDDSHAMRSIRLQSEAAVRRMREIEAKTDGCRRYSKQTAVASPGERRTMRHAGALASLSLDLDNQWSYMKVHGDDGWQSFPSYLDFMVPRALRFFEERGLRLTFFIVGQDAALAKNRSAISAIAQAGHEIACHSFHHEPWLHLFAAEDIDRELQDAEQAIADVTGQRPVGYRGPGYSISPTVLECLRDRGYRYDASTFPSFAGPLARAYYLYTSKLSGEERAKREHLFGSLRDGLRPLKPYYWDLTNGRLLELPVTTMPIIRAPFHFSYIIYLAGYSPAAARHYFGAALNLCRTLGVTPSILLHPLDFLGCDDLDNLSFFPGMKLPAGRKLAILDRLIGDLAREFVVVPMNEYAEAIEAAGDLRSLQPHLLGTKGTSATGFR